MDIGIPEPDRKEIADALSDVLTETYALYIKTHGYHWNVEGPQFSTFHALFMTQYTDLWNSLDEIAERIRSLGFFAPSGAAIYSGATIKADNDVPEALQMMSNLVSDSETVIRTARKALQLAADKGDDATADLMTQRVAVLEKSAWMMRAHLK
ncbi:MAG: DNA starvation/stationary phase protection protein [Hirschia sp.]|nr:DNA starvation/stationary phase protection protein [Hirschia sp.]MBB35719.1 DNA starvation/stationary phase protection protein [Hirschia sp.]MBF17782.1 DNA starvation/stationary phase protection protein [Hirschia sp.]|tara:strand:- start:308 stop:766 length:459 start_codon:yes stop_codon:yes gene_type:complete